MITFTSSENILLDLKKKYYCYYIKFSKSGFFRKVTPKPCYLVDSVVGQKDYFLVFEDEGRTRFIGYYSTSTNLNSLLEYSGIFETFEDCVNSFNSVINNRVGEITKDYNNHLNKLEKSLINI